MNNPVVSIIVVSYNEREYLDQAINGITAQTYPNIQLIIGDDGSSDGSIDYIKELAKDQKIEFFVMERPKNTSNVIASIRVSNVIKRALSISKGDYICLMSGDDFFCDNTKIEKGVAFLEEHPDRSAFVTAYQRQYPDGKKDSHASSFPTSLYLSGEYLHLSCFLFRKEVYEKGLLLERFCDDVGLMFSIAALGEFSYSSEVTFTYRQRSGSIVHEAKELELQIMEMLLLQDILCKGIFVREALARCYVPMHNCYQNRDSLKQYSKYIQCSQTYDNDYLGDCLKYDHASLLDKMKLHGFMNRAAFWHFYFRCRRKMYRVSHKKKA